MKTSELIKNDEKVKWNLIYSASRYLFGIEKLKKLQEDIIKKILLGNDVFAILPTGYGKSLCYIIPGVVSKEKTLVISPLIQLMNDQSKFINKRMGDDFAVVLRELTKKNKIKKIENAKFIFTSPEKLENDEKILLNYSFQNIVIDEAHCISVWSDDFRPAFSRISKPISKLLDQNKNKTSIITLTATADKYIKKDILNNIPFRKNLKTYNKSCFRKNISIYTIKVNNIEDKLLNLVYYLSRFELPGIIYCATKKDVEIVYEFINYLGYNVQKYHSGLVSVRNKTLDKYLNEDNLITVTTNALGLGINKENIRFVIHFSIVFSPQQYIQEIGRIGRDGLAASAILLFNEDDKIILEYLINKTKPSIRKYKKVYVCLKKKQGRSCSSISYISNTEKNECRKILEHLKDLKIVKKINSNYYKNKKLKYNSLNLPDRQRLRKIKLLDSMVKYGHLNNNINKWRWLLEYIGYKFSNRNLKDYQLYLNDWINQEFNQEDYIFLIKKFLKNCYPKLPKNKYHLGGFALSYYSENNNCKIIRTKVGKELYGIKYGKENYIDDIWIKDSANLIYKKYPQDINLTCLCPSNITHPFMKNFADGLSNELNNIGFSTKFIEVIEKIKSSRPQKNMKTIERKYSNLKNIYCIEEKHYKDLKHQKILLIDDIYDSGATIKECSKLLKEMGVDKIYIFTLIKTLR